MKPTLQSLTLLILPVALTILLVAYPAFSYDLEGTWCVYMSVAESQGQNTADYPGQFIESVEPYPIVIEEQRTLDYGTLFIGTVTVGVNEINGFSGAIKGKSITMTHWDSVTWGDLVVKGNKPMEIHFSNNAFRNGEVKVGSTALGIAVKGDCPAE